MVGAGAMVLLGLGAAGSVTVLAADLGVEVDTAFRIDGATAMTAT